MHKGTLSLMLVDIDDMKAINKDWGRSVGDLCIQHLWSTIESIVNPTDFLVRFSGDEVLLILIDSTRERAEFFLQLLQHELEQKQPPSLPIVPRCTASIATLKNTMTMESLLDELLENMRQRKSANKQALTSAA
jgi:diguanylate cyclase (GGDEF)-like protein